ncbi:M15 family metallopeptidase [Promicromonospora sukumoe]|uniref:M15 family metallopeptidase n=1 Tax=Promicromonospora sukumoe TaxID=88382 RepID=UPI003652F784
MRPENHTLVPRRTRRPGAQGAHAAVPAAGHVARPSQMVRRSSFAVAAALTTVALTTTAAVSLAGNDGGSTASAATPISRPVSVNSAVATDAAVRTASEKADAVLSDADYVTREGDLTVKDRAKLREAAKELRTMLHQARDGSATALAMRKTAVASRDGDREALAERAKDATADAEREAAAEAAEPTPAATEPTNLTIASAGVSPISEQHAESLPVLDTPLASSVEDIAAAEAAAEASTDAEQGKKVAAVAPSAAHIEKVTTSLQRLISRTGGDAVVSVKAGPTPEEIAAARREAVLDARASRAAKREAVLDARAARAAKREAVLEARAERAAEAARERAAARAAQAKKLAQAAKQYGNGQIPSSVMCGLSFASGEKLRCDAAAALEDLNRAFRSAFGRNLSLTDGYRSYHDQVAVAASRGALAAVPGTSNHGWGQAVDLGGGIQSFGSAQFRWMQANAGKYGWKHPGWAQAGGSKPEAWHWEYGTSY